jgi:hypothetical protein
MNTKIAMRKRASLSEMQGLLIKDITVLPHPVELSRWRDDGLIEMDLDRGAFKLTDAGLARIKRCCATCESWRQLNMPAAAGGPIGECHNEERLDGMRRLRPALSHYYETCEVHRDRSQQASTAQKPQER